MTNESTQNQLDRIRVLSNPTRLDIYTSLWTDGPGTAQEISLRLGMDELLSYYHLRQLVAAGILKRDSVGAKTRDKAVFSATSRFSIDDIDVDDEAVRKVLDRFIEAIMKQAAQEYRSATASVKNEIHIRSYVARYATRMTQDKQDELKKKLRELSDWIDANGSLEGDRISLSVALLPIC